MFIYFSTIIYQVTCSKQTKVTHSAVELIAMSFCKSQSLHGTNQEGKTNNHWTLLDAKAIYTLVTGAAQRRRDSSFT